MSDYPEGHIRNPKPNQEVMEEHYRRPPVSAMPFIKVVRKPFIVEAIEVTTDNINDIAVHVGTLRKKENGTPYIQVDRRLVPNILFVYPGFWMTKMGDNIRCYSKRAFNEQFVPSSPDIEKWVDFLNREPIDV